jgi:hypothetical protein
MVVASGGVAVCIYCAVGGDLGGMSQHSLDEGRSVMDSHKVGVLPISMAVSMTDLTRAMQIFGLKMDQWFMVVMDSVTCA